MLAIRWCARVPSSGLSADIAQKSELAKGLLFQAEDRRELQEFAGMQESYQNLFNLNRDLLASYSTAQILTLFWTTSHAF